MTASVNPITYYRPTGTADTEVICPVCGIAYKLLEGHMCLVGVGGTYYSQYTQTWPDYGWQDQVIALLTEIRDLLKQQKENK